MSAGPPASIPGSEIKVAVLDDYQKVAEGCAEWERLGADVAFFGEHFADPVRLAEELGDHGRHRGHAGADPVRSGPARIAPPG